MWSFYIPSMVCVVLACFHLLRKYAAPKVHWFAKILVLAGWLTSISIVALVPIDVWATLVHKQTKSIFLMWTISYWSTQLLTWILIPFAQGYFDAGDFTFWGKLKQALKDRVIYFASLGVVGVIAVAALLLSGKLSFKELLPWAIVLANTYGLMAGICLLGYGLVSIPRETWKNADPEASLRWAVYRIGIAAEKLEEAALDMQRCATVVETTSKTMSSRDPLRPYMNKIYAQAEAESPVKPSEAARDLQGRINLEDLSEGDLDYGTDERGLASLRCRLSHTVYKFYGLKAKYVSAVKRAQHLEIVCRNRREKFIVSLDKPSSNLNFKQCWMMYQCLLQPWIQRLMAVVLAGMSFMFVWSEATIGTGKNPDLSPFSRMIDGGQHGEVATQILTSLPLTYMCGSAYYSLFKLVIFSYYRMVPKATDPRSLLLNAGQVCRFAAPLAFNFMHVIRMNEKTVFAQKMGAAMDVVVSPVFGSDFNTWFPITVVIYCLLLYLNVLGAIVGVCLPRKFRFGEEHTDNEHSERGRLILKQEQDAEAQNLDIGDCLGLWGSIEAPRTGSATKTSSRTSLRPSPVSLTANGASMAPLFTSPSSQLRSSSPGFQIEQGVPRPTGGLGWGWSRGKSASDGPAETSGVGIATGFSRASSKRLSLTGGRGHSRAGSTSKAIDLDNLFARLESGSEGAGRIDDDFSPPSGRSQVPLNWK